MQNSENKIFDKWGDCIRSGWLALPAILLEQQDALKLTCLEMIILQNLLLAWRQTDTKIYIRSSTMAKRLNLHQRSIQRGLTELIKKGFIHRIKAEHKDDQVWTYFDVKPTVIKLNEFKRLNYVNNLSNEEMPIENFEIK